MKQKTVDEESAIIFYAEHVEAFEKFFQSIYSLDYPWGIYNTPFMRINITDAKDKSMWFTQDFRIPVTYFQFFLSTEFWKY